MLNYPTISGIPVLLKIVRDNGENPPLGSEVFDADGKSLAMVGRRVVRFLRGLESDRVVGGALGPDDPDKRCTFEYRLPESGSGRSQITSSWKFVASPVRRSEVAFAD